MLKLDAVRGDVALTSVTSNYQRRVTFEADYTQYQDYAFFGNPWPLTGAADDYGTGFYETHQNNTSEELRLSSVDPNDRLVWVAGLYYEYARQVDTVFVPIRISPTWCRRSPASRSKRSSARALTKAAGSPTTTFAPQTARPRCSRMPTSRSSRP